MKIHISDDKDVQITVCTYRLIIIIKAHKMQKQGTQSVYTSIQ